MFLVAHGKSYWATAVARTTEVPLVTLVVSQYVCVRTGIWYLTLLGPQSRYITFGDKLLRIWVVCPQNRTAVLKRSTKHLELIDSDLVFCRVQ